MVAKIGLPIEEIKSLYGYERNPDLPLLIPSHLYCDPEHTRRGAWRGAFCALGVIHGFENSWGTFQTTISSIPRSNALRWSDAGTLCVQAGLKNMDGSDFGASTQPAATV
jgi:hypothetical protein